MLRIAFPLLALAAPAFAHELWIEPHAYHTGADGILKADIVNGQHFKGIRLSYLPFNFTRFDVMFDGQVTAVDGRMGDQPALFAPAKGDGLHVVAYEATPMTVAYDGMEKFTRFTTHKGATEVLEQHATRGLPTSGFREVYSRHVKALICAASCGGADAAMGLETEFIALENPALDDMSDGMDVQLVYQDMPRAQVLVTLFDKSPDGAVVETLLTTDDTGRVTLPVQAGHSYLADAVVFRVPDPKRAVDYDAVWETLWAGLTFEVPK